MAHIYLENSSDRWKHNTRMGMSKLSYRAASIRPRFQKPWLGTTEQSRFKTVSRDGVLIEAHMEHHHAIGPKNHSSGTGADVSLLCRNRVTLKKCRVKPKVETNAGWVPLCCMFQEPLCGVTRAGKFAQTEVMDFQSFVLVPRNLGFRLVFVFYSTTIPTNQDTETHSSITTNGIQTRHWHDLIRALHYLA